MLSLLLVLFLSQFLILLLFRWLIHSRLLLLLPSGFKGGVGVKVSQQAEVIVEDCIMHSHDGVGVLFDEYDDLGERYDNCARVRIANSVLKQCGVATFSSRGNTSGAVLRARQLHVHGANLWANADRPGCLELVDNEVLNLTVAPGRPARDSKLAGVCLSVARGRVRTGRDC